MIGPFLQLFIVASLGGVIRNYWGHFIVGFAPNLGQCTIVKVKFWAILHTSQLAISSGFLKLKIKIDPQLVV